MMIKDIMTRSVVTVEMDDSLQTVKDIFDHARFHHLLVVDRGKLAGVISDRDLFKAISPYLGTGAETSRDLATLNRKVHQIMTRKLVTIKPDAGLYQAIKIFNRQNISCIPVVDDDLVPLGIISWRDILRALEST